MAKQFLLYCLLLTVMACGQKSTIKTDVHPEKLSCTYGDCQYITRKIPLAIVPNDPVNGSLPKTLSALGPGASLIGGIAGILMNVGTTIGTKKFTFDQPVPYLPDELVKSVKLSRVFFYIEPVEGERRWKDFVREFITGKTDVTFDFIKKIAVLATPKRIDNPEGSLKAVFKLDSQGEADPEVKMKSFERDRYFSLFNDNDLYGKLLNLNRQKEVVVLKYDGLKRKQYLSGKNLDSVYLIHTKNPAGVIDHLLYNMNFRLGPKEEMVHYQVLEDSIVVEIRNDPVVRNLFREGMRIASTYQELGIKEWEKCHEQICLDIPASDVNLLPLIIKENAVQIDAFVDIGRVPGQFKLKGFVEFEVKLDSPF